jgi:hypothetical protein
MADTKKKVYLAVRKKTTGTGVISIDPFNGYLLDKQYLNSKAGVYLVKEGQLVVEPEVS